MSKKAVFVLWYMLLTSLGRSFISQSGTLTTCVDFGERVLYPILILITGWLICVITSFSLSLLIREMRPFMSPEQLREISQGPINSFQFIHSFIHSFHLSIISPNHPSFHPFIPSFIYFILFMFLRFSSLLNMLNWEI
jgi:hypothetical protein